MKTHKILHLLPRNFSGTAVKNHFSLVPLLYFQIMMPTLAFMILFIFSMEEQHEILPEPKVAVLYISERFTQRVPG